MKNKIKLISLLLLFTFFVPMLYSSVPMTHHFTVSKEVLDNTEFSNSLQIFCDYAEAFYSLPDDLPPTDIFREPEIWDPLEPYNRLAYSFNIYLSKWAIKPLSDIYSFIVPKYVREGIARIDANIQTPGRLINSLLQARFKRAGIELARFGINTTLGIIGFYDIAYDWYDLEPRIIDFGTTFASWGIGRGFYFVIPVYGSTCFRDAVGLAGDYLTNPITYIPPYFTWDWIMFAIRWGIKGGFAFNRMTLQLENFMRFNQSSLDPYESMKTVWLIFENIKETRDSLD